MRRSILPLLTLAILALGGVGGCAGVSEKPPSARLDPPLDTVPLPPGLTPVRNEGLLFATPVGRIVQATAEGAVDVDEVYTFYKRTLPPLGWDPVDARTYAHTGEQLRLDVSGVTPNANTVVRFTLTPTADESGT